ncbi:MAG: ribulose-phosphate 3-epimerase, partial [Deltaproteobacteria bacterium]|nr:ribulose-phosphate 3-epimerase [Deltaproteobacteria bacterium]
MILSPSLLSADFGHMAEELQALEQAGLTWVHWDIMDGHFVPNLTFGAPVIKKLRPASKLFFDVHLMIEHPEQYLQDFAEAGADLLVVHAETATHLPRTLEQIKRLGLRCGVALNPATPLCCLDYILPDLDLVLLMSVNPGFGGQRFMPGTYAKIARLKQMIASIPPGAEAAAAAKLMIQIDGGV